MSSFAPQANQAFTNNGDQSLMKTVSVQLPETVFSVLRKTPDDFVREMRIAAIKWYELGDISQGKATEIAGLTRAEFINAARYQVDFMQYTEANLIDEINHVR